MRPLTTPTVNRRCSCCGTNRAFICSQKFRVNAHQKRLDVWLIYNCGECDESWNLRILSRVARRSIDPDLYDAFLRNDASTVWQYAFDLPALRSAGAHPDLGIPFKVTGRPVGDIDLDGEHFRVRVDSDYVIHVRLAKVLCA